MPGVARAPRIRRTGEQQTNSPSVGEHGRRITEHVCEVGGEVSLTAYNLSPWVTMQSSSA
jgi:hypothetical protein